MGWCLGYYGSSDEISHKLDYDGKMPVISETTKTGIINAIANDYPDIKSCSDRDKKAIVSWVVNEADWR